MVSPRHVLLEAQSARPSAALVVALTIAFSLSASEAFAGETKPAPALLAAPAAAATAPSKATPPAEPAKTARVASISAPQTPGDAHAAPPKAPAEAHAVPPKEPAAVAKPAPPKEPAAVAKPAPPKEPAAVAKPAPAWSPPPSPAAVAAARTCAAVTELRSDLKEALSGEARDLSPDQREEKDSLEAELAKERGTYLALLKAVEKGVLQRSTLADAIERSEKHVSELAEKVAGIKPVRGRGLASMPERLDALTLSMQALELRISQSSIANEGPTEGPPAAPAPGSDHPAAAEPPAAAPESKAFGLNLDAGIAGLYAFRGLNVFKANSQMDQHALFSPGVTYNPTWAEGLSVGYWGAYQVTGDNASQLVKQGIGNEQDLTVSYGRDIVKEKVQARVGVTNYVYPFAERAVAKTNTPYFFEPWTQVTYVGAVTASVLGTYFYGTQDAVRPLSYVYVHPAVEKTFTVNKAIGFVPGAGLGYKAFTHNNALTDNRYEITGDMKLPIVSGENSYVTPGVHYAWTNFSNSAAVASAHAVWLSMNIGLNL